SIPDHVTFGVVLYPHPTLRRKSKPVKRVNARLRRTVRQMFELMYESRGVGLAANQVDVPLRLFVANPMADPDEGEELVFINPVLSHPKGREEGEEGCLSFPEVFGPVTRAKQIHVQAYGLDGTEISADLDGFLSRIVQHETDHLEGMLFPDRMTATHRMAVAEDLEAFELEHKRLVAAGKIPSESRIETRLLQWEREYC
ncbi:MAG: peptide deformylase, partial [Planctomycetota bacterium]